MTRSSKAKSAVAQASSKGVTNMETPLIQATLGTNDKVGLKIGYSEHGLSLLIMLRRQPDGGPIVTIPFTEMAEHMTDEQAAYLFDIASSRVDHWCEDYV